MKTLLVVLFFVSSCLAQPPKIEPRENISNNDLEVETNPSVDENIDDQDQNTIDTPTDPDPGGPATGSVAINFVPVSYGGNYAPRNVYAIWISTLDDQRVKTLEVRMDRRRFLAKWLEQTQGLDAVTGPTVTDHQPRSVIWDLTDQSGAPVTKGNYKLFVEYTEQNGPGRDHFVEFSISNQVSSKTDNSNQFFTNIAIDHTP